MQFDASPKRTVGVEWELQLLDPVTLDLVDGIIPLMEFFPDSKFIKPEYIQSCVELNSCIAENSAEAVAHLRESLMTTLQRCIELEMSLCGAGTHPFCRRLALITPLPRYQEMEESTGYRAHQQITFSTHVHVGMSSGDEAMRVMSWLIPAMPAFIALSANSPFWRGHNTDYAAYRHQILAAATNYGLPPRFDSWKDFQKFYSAAKRAGMIAQIKDIHWDIRPHPDFGTLEIRVMDAASDLRHLHGLSAFARSMVIGVAHAENQDLRRILPLDLPGWAQKQNRSSAAKYGLNATLIVDADGNHRPLREFVQELIDFCEPLAMQHDESYGLSIAADLLHDVPSYERQIEAYRENNSARSTVKWLQKTMENECNEIDHRPHVSPGGLTQHRKLGADEAC